MHAAAVTKVDFREVAGCGAVSRKRPSSSSEEASPCLRSPTQADLERWESDEDSEDSDAERDGDEAEGGALSEAQMLRLMA